MNNDHSAAAQLIDPMESRLGYQLRRASTLMMADLTECLAEIDLRPADASVLTLVGANPSCNQTDIGRTLGIKRANMVPIIAKLIEMGLIERAPIDGRSLALWLTPAGETAARRIDAIITDHEAGFVKNLDKIALDALIRSLQIVRATARRRGPVTKHAAP